MGLRGAIAAAVTPMRDGGRHLDDEAFAPLVRYLVEGGIDGLLACGTTGEGVLLSVDERRRVAESFLAARPDGFQVAIHAGAQTTSDTVALAAHALDVGADAVAVIAPPYFPLDAEELTRHFVQVANACDPLPFYLYEFAARSGYAIPIGRDRAGAGALAEPARVEGLATRRSRPSSRTWRSRAWTCSSATSRWSWRGWSGARSARSAGWRPRSRRSRRRSVHDRTCSGARPGHAASDRLAGHPVPRGAEGSPGGEGRPDLGRRPGAATRTHGRGALYGACAGARDRQPVMEALTAGTSAGEE